MTVCSAASTITSSQLENVRVHAVFVLFYFSMKLEGEGRGGKEIA